MEKTLTIHTEREGRSSNGDSGSLLLSATILHCHTVHRCTLVEVGKGMVPQVLLSLLGIFTHTYTYVQHIYINA